MATEVASLRDDIGALRLLVFETTGMIADTAQIIDRLSPDEIAALRADSFAAARKMREKYPRLRILGEDGRPEPAPNSPAKFSGFENWLRSRLG